MKKLNQTVLAACVWQLSHLVPWPVKLKPMKAWISRPVFSVV